MDGRPVIVGLLGGVASGKSTVAEMLGKLGAVVIDADRIAHEVLECPDILEAVVALVGSSARDDAGRPVRSEIAAGVFTDPERLARLEELVHPAIRERIAREIDAAGGARMVVIDAPLLVEGNLDRIADTLVFVDAPEEMRSRRALDDRGWDADEVREREAHQAPLEGKRGRADLVLENDGDLASLERRVEELYRIIEEEGDGS